MAEAGEPPTHSDADIGQLTRLLVQVNDLVVRYRHRETLRPEAEIAGGSRSLLINLHRAALVWLPPGPVADSVTELLTERDVQLPPQPVSDSPTSLSTDVDLRGSGRLILADELDLLEAVLQELKVIASSMLGDHVSEVELPPALGGPLPRSYPPPALEEGPSGPSTPQKRERHCAQPSIGPACISSSSNLPGFL
jgi:hypothetical protein